MAKQGQIQITKLPLNKIHLNRNSRLNIDPDELDGLMQSIKEEGVLQPIGVVNKNGKYEICYGNRRFLAVSKLGYSSIPAIIHQAKTEADVDIKNLTENIQRRSVSLAEVGRYIDLLHKQGLSRNEAAVRLGVPLSYIKSCDNAFAEVPKEFQGDLEVNFTGRKGGAAKPRPGKISIRTANAIITARKRGKVNSEGAKALFKAAKSADNFTVSDLPQYIDAVNKGKKDFTNGFDKHVTVNIAFRIKKSDKEDLEAKYVDDGPFSSFTALVLAVLKGEKAVKINLAKI